MQGEATTGAKRQQKQHTAYPRNNLQPSACRFAYRRFDGLIESALALRSTTSTQRNDVSSRSHSILTITLKDDAKERRLRREEEERLRLEKEKRLEEGGGEEVEEVEPEKRYASLPLDNTHPAYDLIKKSLRLVDLAGSEQNVDTGKMAARDHKERWGSIKSDVRATLS